MNVQDAAAASALLVAVGGAFKAPVLIDHYALARHGIDPAKATVTLPRSKTTYSLALRKLLFQAGLKLKLRCDEAGMPFLWVTSVKPGSDDWAAQPKQLLGCVVIQRQGPRRTGPRAVA